MASAVGKDKQLCLTHDKLWKDKTQQLANECRDIIPTRIRKQFTHLACICNDKRGIDEFRKEWGTVGHHDLTSSFKEMELFIEKETPDTLYTLLSAKTRTGSKSISSHIGCFLGNLKKKGELDGLDDDNKNFPKSVLRLIYMLKEWIKTGFVELKGVSEEQCKVLIGVNGKRIKLFEKQNSCRIDLKSNKGKVFAMVSKKDLKLPIKETGHSGYVTCDSPRRTEQVRLAQLRKLGADYVKYVQDDLGGTGTQCTTQDDQQNSGITAVEQDINMVRNKDTDDTTTISNVHEFQVDVDIIKEGRLYCLHERVNVDEPPIKDSKALQKHFHVCETSKCDSNFPMNVAVTEIGAGSSRWKYIQDITSKICHFGIVPLMAYWECTELNLAQFIYPYPDKGSLEKAIQTKMLTPTDACTSRILYQVISAIQYLHSENDNKRKQFLHMDVCSENIVLDSKGNARLIDLGFPHDVGDGVFRVSGQEKKTVYHDFGNFGIVIRQVLTGKFSREKLKQEYTLRNIPSEQLQSYLQEPWIERTDDDATTLLTSSQNCIDSVEKQTIKVEDIKKDIEEVLRNNSGKRWLPIDLPDENEVKCEVCMVNPTVDESILSNMHDAEQCNFLLCAACMRNADFNPIVCHSCDEIITPPIGAGWGAILIAGNDEREENNAKQFTKDITDIQKIFTDKTLPVLCLSEDVIELVSPETPGTKTDMKDSVKTAFKNLETKNLKTLVLVFSGHHDAKKGFLLGHNNEFITKEDLCSQMKSLHKTVQKFVVFLDCCEAPDLLWDLITGATVNHKLIQLNACGAKQKAKVHGTYGSLFIRFIIQALTRDSERTACLNNTLIGSKSKCNQKSDHKDKDCEVKTSGDFIMVSGLIKYVESHIKDYCTHMVTKDERFNPVRAPQPTLKATDKIIAFKCDWRRVKLKCSLKNKWKPKATVEAVDPTRFISLTEVKKLLLSQYTDAMKVWSGLDEEFSDVLTMEVDGEEITSVQELMNAWSCDREILFFPRVMSMTTDVRVACRLHNAPAVYDFLLLKMYNETQREEQEERDGPKETKYKVVELQKGDVDRMIGYLTEHQGHLGVPSDGKQRGERTLNCFANILKSYNRETLQEKKLRIIFPVQPNGQTLVRDIVCLQIV